MFWPTKEWETYSVYVDMDKLVVQNIDLYTTNGLFEKRLK